MRRRRLRRLCLAVLPTVVSAWLVLAAPASAGFALSEFDGSMQHQNGEPATQAGSHPFLISTSFSFTTFVTPGGRLWPSGTLKDADVDLPAGLVANPEAYPTCSDQDLVGAGGAPSCPASSQVGVLILKGGGGTAPFNQVGGLFNMERPEGAVAVLGANINSSLIHLVGGLRAGSDFGIRIALRNLAQTVPVLGGTVILWGTPASPAFDSQRRPAGPSTAAARPFLTLPTSCLGPLLTDLRVTTWEGESDSASFLSHDNATPVPSPASLTGCDALDFSPTLRARPTTGLADSPSGLEVDVHVPQDGFDDPEQNVEAQLRDAVVSLPRGLVFNPATANGLAACPAAATACPDAAKLGTVEAVTPLLDHPLSGSIYLAAPYENPFGSLLALYLAIDDRQSGIAIKLAGRVDADPDSGHLTVRLDDLPQLPLENLRLRFFDGPRAALRTPPLCGAYTTASALTPWSAPSSGPPATPSDSYRIDAGAGGAACPGSPTEQPNAPGFEAGAVSPVAGAESPFLFTVERSDGSQQLASLALTLPPGLVAAPAGIPSCPDAALAAAATRTGQEEALDPSCPGASRVGALTVAAGAGADPYRLSGSAYLAGPYKGAPFSLALVAPALAGPFDLGTVVVRAGVRVDPRTAQITAGSDPFPTILSGIPLDIRSVALRLDRPGFTRNPTSCEPTAVLGSARSTLGQEAPLRSRFQLGECGRLGFAPKLSLALAGAGGRNGHPALMVKWRPRSGDANLARVALRLPRSMLLEQSHSRGVCTRARFATHTCPPRSVYGKAEAVTPLLDQPLSGEIYLLASDHRLPDLAVALRGPDHQPVDLELIGRVDSVRGAIRISFGGLPDAPLSGLRLRLRGGRRGLLVNARGACVSRPRASVRAVSQNGKSAQLSPRLRAGCSAPARSNQLVAQFKAP